MLGRPAGWFRDPAPRVPTAPDTLRFWDGTAWTARTRTGTKKQRRQWREDVAREERARLEDLYLRAEAGDEQAHGELVALVRPVSAVAGTRDGQRYAGWWARYGATVVDSWLFTALGCLLGWPFLSQVVAELGRFVDSTTRARQQGSPAPSVDMLLDAVAVPLLLITLVFLAVSLAYEVGFLRGLQATPGKLLFGLQVRPLESGARLSWRAAFLRWTGKNGVGVVQLVPFGFLLVGVYALLDGLWPLGDRHKQSLHDKLARTYVVRRA